MTKKFLATIALFAQFSFLLLVPQQAHALPGLPGSFGGVAGGVGNQVMSAIGNFIESSLNLNVTDALQPFSESQNAAENKATPPTVSLRFSPQNPKPGEEVTAYATVMGITNTDTAYYTWYLKRGDGEPTLDEIEDYKITAVKEHVKTYFDIDRFDDKFNNPPGSGLSNNDEIDDPEYGGEGGKTGGVIGLMGGLDSFAPKSIAGLTGDPFINEYTDAIKDHESGAKSTYCYIYDRNTGIPFEISENEDFEFECPDGTTALCMQDIRTDNLCPITGREEQQETEGTDDGSGNTAETSITKEGACPVNAPLAQCLPAGTPSCAAGTEGDSDGTTTCPSGSTAYCVANDFLGGGPDGCSEPRDISYYKCGGGEHSADGSMCVDFEEFGKLFPAGGCTATDKYLESANNLCTPDLHLFPQPDVGVTGDGLFGVPTSEEEYFWGLDPRNDNTTPFGPDEAFVAGAGVKQYTWIYQAGDELGVVVEGRGNIPTKHEDSSYQTVFAYINGCDLRDISRGFSDDKFYRPTVRGKGVKIPTVSLSRKDLNQCIIEGNNFVKPGGSERNDLDVRVAAGDPNTITPKAPGYSIPFNANVGHKDGASTTSPQQVNYRWNIACSTAADGDFENITDQLNPTKRTSITDPQGAVRQVGIHNAIEGSGLSSLNVLTEDLPDSCFGGDGEGYVKATLTVNEPGYKERETNFGKSELIVPVTNNPSTIEAYQTTVTADHVTRGSKICTEEDGFNNVLCRTVPGEVLALHVPNLTADTQDVQWTVNSTPIYCNSNIADCEPNNGTIFYPVTERAGDALSVVATINDPSTPQKTQTVSREFAVVNPQIIITPTSGAQKKILGSYLDTEGNQFLDESDSTFIADTDGTVTLAASIIPAFAAENTKLEWFVNGQSQGISDTISFVLDGPSTISVRARLSAPLENRTFLTKNFNVSQFSTSPTSLAAQATVLTQTNDLVRGQKNTFFAAVSQNAPSYFIFLLKIVFTIGLMLFTASLVLRFGEQR